MLGFKTQHNLNSFFRSEVGQNTAVAEWSYYKVPEILNSKLQTR